MASDIMRFSTSFWGCLDGDLKHFYLFLQSGTTHNFTTMPRQTWSLTSKKDWLYLLCVIYFTPTSVTGRERWDTQLQWEGCSVMSRMSYDFWVNIQWNHIGCTIKCSSLCLLCTSHPQNVNKNCLCTKFSGWWHFTVSMLHMQCKKVIYFINNSSRKKYIIYDTPSNIVLLSNKTFFLCERK